MKTLLILVGKTTDKSVAKLTEDYISRIGHYIQFEVNVIPDLKNTSKLTEAQIKTAEGENIMKLLRPGDHCIVSSMEHNAVMRLLDEHGKEYRSVDFATKLNKLWSNSARRIVFIIGGPYGFSQKPVDAANESISLSKMTFSHQMVRLIFVEQLYRALTILNHEPYHHE